jgi:hypothetical protein
VSEARWTLSVEDFGPIKSASVTLAPFTVFTGHNNTGKSYMASLIWAALNSSTILNLPGALHGPAFEAVDELVSNIRAGRKSVVEGSDWEKLIDWLNVALNDRSLGLVERILACADFRGPGCRITVSASVPPLRVRIRDLELPEERVGVIAKLGTITSDASGRHFTFFVPPEPDETALEQSIRSVLIRSLARPFGPAVYIPSARTGLMFALKTLIASLFSLSADEDAESRSNLPLPVRLFLGDVNYSRDQPEHEHYAIAKSIENNILNGQIIQSETGDFRFAFSPSAKPLPLHATSSLITELAPFIVLLKGGLRGSVIFEEPEAHLHLDAQRVLARALVRLVNLGTPVLVTTHGDTFLQQINLLMHLSTHPARDKLATEFGYEMRELLDPKDALGYRFEKEKGGTVVQAMEKTSGGFVEPAMNMSIATQTHEIYRMESAEADE